MHTRRVEYRGFRRDDGLWDIEGDLLDTKPYAFEIEGEGEWAPGEPIHQMSIRVTLDEAMVIRELGAMKVAQGFNPERRSGDLGLSRMGSSELLVQLLERGRDYAAAWRAFAAGTGDKPKFDASLEQLRLVFDKKVPVLIHTAGARDCIATARMFQ